MTPAQPHDDAAIREQAYLLWEKEGRPDGREMEFWTRAQVKVAESSQLKHLTKPAPKGAKAAKAEDKPKGAAAKVKASASTLKAAPAKASKAKADKTVGKGKPKTK